MADEIDRLRDAQSSRLRRRGRVLPHQRPVPSLRGGVHPGRHAVQGGRRGALLRAPRGAGRDRLPAGDREPGRRRVASGGSSTCPSGASGTRPRVRWPTLAARERISFGDALRRVDEIEGLATRSASQLTGFAAFMDEHEAMVADGAAGGRDPDQRAGEVRLPRRAERLRGPAGPDPAGEPDRTGRGGPRVRRGAAATDQADLAGRLDELAASSAERRRPRWRRTRGRPGRGRGRAGPSLGAFLERVALVADSDQIPDRRARRRGGHPDDAAHRQGPGVRHGVPDRPRGRRLPPPAGADRQRPSWRRSAGWRTSGSPGRASGCTSPGRSSGGVGRARSTTRRAGSWPRSPTGWWTGADWPRPRRAGGTPRPPARRAGDGVRRVAATADHPPSAPGGGRRPRRSRRWRPGTRCCTRASGSAR